MCLTSLYLSYYYSLLCICKVCHSVASRLVIFAISHILQTFMWVHSWLHWEILGWLMKLITSFVWPLGTAAIIRLGEARKHIKISWVRWTCFTVQASALTEVFSAASFWRMSISLLVQECSRICVLSFFFECRCKGNLCSCWKYCLFPYLLSRCCSVADFNLCLKGIEEKRPNVSQWLLYLAVTTDFWDKLFREGFTF